MSCCPPAPVLLTSQSRGEACASLDLTYIELFAEAVAWEDGKLRRLGRVDMRRNLLAAFATTLSREDIVVVDATGNAAAVAGVLGPHVKRVVIANPMQVRMIAHAKIETDTIDAGVLAQLYASGFLPEVWIPDATTQALQRQVTRRNQIVRQRTRLKNIIQSILHAHLIPACPTADLCGSKGRAWLSTQVLPEDERLAVEQHLRELDRLGEDLAVSERGLAHAALADENVARLMAIPGVDMVGALADRSDRRYQPLRRTGEACELSRSQSERPTIGTRLPWPDHQARARTCPRHAGGGGLGRRLGGWLRFLSADQGEGQATSRRRRDGPQARGPDLASLAQRRKLRLGASGVAGAQASHARTQSRA
jgi:transposase